MQEAFDLFLVAPQFQTGMKTWNFQDASFLLNVKRNFYHSQLSKDTSEVLWRRRASGCNIFCITESVQTQSGQAHV